MFEPTDLIAQINIPIRDLSERHDDKHFTIKIRDGRLWITKTMSLKDEIKLVPMASNAIMVE